MPSFKNNGPGGCCCGAGPTRTVNLTLFQGCSFGVRGQEVASNPYTITRGGTTVASGTTNSTGGVPSVSLAAGTYAISATGYGSPRYVDPTTFTVPAGSGTFGLTVTIQAAPGYVCCGPCYFPVSNRMTVNGTAYAYGFDILRGMFSYSPTSGSGVYPITCTPGGFNDGSNFGVTACTFSSPVVTTFSAGGPPYTTMTETTPVP